MPASPVYVLRIGTTLVWVDKTRDGNRIGSPDRARRSAENGLSRNVCEVGISTNEGFVIMNVDGAIQLMSLLVSLVSYMRTTIRHKFISLLVWIVLKHLCPWRILVTVDVVRSIFSLRHCAGIIVLQLAAAAMSFNTHNAKVYVESPEETNNSERKAPFNVQSVVPTSANPMDEKQTISGWFHWHEPGTSTQEKKLIFKLDFFILTYGCLTYFIKQLDQTNITNAYASGMKEELNFGPGNELSFMNTYFNIGVLVGSSFANFAMSFVRPRFWLPFCLATWSLFVLFLYKCEYAYQFYILRVCSSTWIY